MSTSSPRSSIVRSLMLAVFAGGIVAATAGTSSASPPAPNGHNCAGSVVSTSAGPGFGTAVSTAAQLQLVDNFGLANCGQPPRRNP